MMGTEKLQHFWTSWLPPKQRNLVSLRGSLWDRTEYIVESNSFAPDATFWLLFCYRSFGTWLGGWQISDRKSGFLKSGWDPLDMWGHGSHSLPEKKGSSKQIPQKWLGCIDITEISLTWGPDLCACAGHLNSLGFDLGKHVRKPWQVNCSI